MDTQHHYRWAFLVYMAGDNNLEPCGLQDLEEMKVAGSTPDVAIVAQFDGRSDQGTRRYFLRPGGTLADDIVETLKETNTGDPAVLKDFVVWAAANYPADRTALVLWNHGSGWKDDSPYHPPERDFGTGPGIPHSYIRGMAENPRRHTLFRTTYKNLFDSSVKRGILFDDTSADFLDNQELSRALRESVRQIGRPIDLIGFDACLMNMLEVSYQVKDACQVMVGSQDKEPGDGWPYDEILRSLQEKPDLPAESLGKKIVEAFGRYYAHTSPSSNITQSAVRLDKVNELGLAAHRLGSCLLASLGRQDVPRSTILSALRDTQNFRDKDYIDIWDFCEKLMVACGGQPDICSAAQSVLDCFSKTGSPVLKEVHQGKFVPRAHGLSIYLPNQSLSPLYAMLDFAAQGEWDDFLSAWVKLG